MHLLADKTASRIHRLVYALDVNIEEIVAELEREIARLEQARELLTSREGNAAPKQWYPAQRSVSNSTPKRKLSPAAKARISEAQKRRWAAQKKTAKKNAAPSANTAD